MENFSCDVYLQFNLGRSEAADGLRSTLIANCVFNILLSYTAIMLNIVTIHAVNKTSSLPKTLRTLLLSLAVSDVTVGLLVQPLFISLLINFLEERNPSCTTLKVFTFFFGFFSAASFLGVVAVSVDRFLAVHLHLRYYELVTHKRVVSVVISVWILSAFLSLTVVWVPSGIRSLILFITGCFCILVTTIIYIWIYVVAHRHNKRIQSQQMQQAEQTGEMSNFSRVMKSTVGAFYVNLVFLLCYLPYFVCLVVTRINGSNIATKKFLYFSLTIVFLNSSLNPVIYCWKI